jgi:predicted ATPase/DNA-binding SARP family transcriptional activator
VTGEPQRRETLATLFWPDSSQSSARAALRRDLSVLNKALDEEWLLIERETISLRTGAGFWLDVAQFKERVADCAEVTPACLESLTEAVNLYREDFLAGFTLPDCPAFDEWQYFQNEGLRQELASALERLAQAYAFQHDFEIAIPYARRRLKLDPLHEPAHQQLMKLYVWNGQRGAALRQYADSKRVLEAELGVLPSEESDALYRAIKTNQGFPPLPPTESEARSDQHQPPAVMPSHNLPAQTTSFIGRAPALAAVRDQLTHPEVRLLTLTGPGGTGKTRLALEAANGVLALFADGVFFVDLAPLTDPTLVDFTIAETLGIRPTGNRPVIERLKENLRNKQMLLVLDNLEHVLSAAPIVTELLAAAPRLKAMVTSRTLLRLNGEWDYPVPPLALPDPERLPALESLRAYEAVILFCDRAKAVNPAFVLTADNASTVTQICVRLDGLPLAIELSAARMRLLPPRKLLVQLESRLPFLTGGARDLPARQQTLRATIDWSYELLEAAEQLLFQRLAVFAGGFTLDAAEAVAGVSSEIDVLNRLQSLIDKNLLKQTEVEPELRIDILETIREYALERLTLSGQLEETRRAHAHYFLELAEEAEPYMYGAEQLSWVMRLETEHDNLRSALQWSIESDGVLGLRMAGALGRFWHMHAHHSEGLRWLTRALGGEVHDVDARRYRAKALNRAGMLSYLIVDKIHTRSLAEQSVSLWREVNDKGGLADALCDLGTITHWQGDKERGHALLEESIDLFRQVDDEKGLVRAIYWYGASMAYSKDEHEEARSNLEEVLLLGPKVGDIANVAAAKWVLGNIAVDQGDHVRARSLYEESLSSWLAIEDKPGIALAHGALGLLTYFQRKDEEARPHLEESRLVWTELGNDRDPSWQLFLLGSIALRQGDPKQAADLFERSLLTDVTAERRPSVAFSMAGLAAVAQTDTELERAARLVGISEELQRTADPPRLNIIRDLYRDIVASLGADREHTKTVVRAALEDEAFEEAFTEGQAMSLDQALAYALRR